MLVGEGFDIRLCVLFEYLLNKLFDKKMEQSKIYFYRFSCVNLAVYIEMYRHMYILRWTLSLLY